jgi:hypothetical protein
LLSHILLAQTDAARQQSFISRSTSLAITQSQPPGEVTAVIAAFLLPVYGISSR